MPEPIPPSRRPVPPRPGAAASAPDPSFWGTDADRRRVPRPRMAGGFEVVRDRFDSWRADGRAGVIVMVVVAVIAGVVWYRVGVSGGSDTTAAPRTDAAHRSSATAPAVTSTTSSTRLVVHVAGAVVRPGVVELPAGSRVIDAIEAAGGGVPNADLDRLNLAAKLVDGERVLVEHVGDPSAPGTSTDGSDATTTGSDTGGVLNLNTATEAQLEELPGIGPSLAAAIITERDRRGGFRSINELREVHGIGEKRFADLRDHVTV